MQGGCRRRRSTDYGASKGCQPKLVGRGTCIWVNVSCGRTYPAQKGRRFDNDSESAKACPMMSPSPPIAITATFAAPWHIRGYLVSSVVRHVGTRMAGAEESMHVRLHLRPRTPTQQ